MKKKTGIALFSLLTLILGAFAGVIVWVVLRIINLLTDLIWTVIPEAIFGNAEGVLPGGNSIIYNLAVCLLGAVVIGLFQKKNGILPHEMEEVIGVIKTEGGYPYNRLHIIAIAAIFPLIFGGTLGPEAGLTGLIAGLCCWIGDSLKSRGHKLFGEQNGEVLAETGLAVAMGIIFNAPLAGIVGNLEPDDKSEKYKEKLLNKKERIFIYCVGVLGGVLAMKGMGALLELLGVEAEGGLPRFSRVHEWGFSQWKWFIPLFAAGLILALFYKSIEHITQKLASKVAEHRIISCMIPAVFLAVIGYFLPYSMFSGEHQLGDFITGYEGMAVSMLILTAFAKLFLVNMCISFGWRGGSIFPIIFGGSAAGYALALIFGMDGAFAVAVLVAALYAYNSRKPGVVVAVMLLCFPVTYLPAIIVSAVLAAKIPAPWDKKQKQETEKQDAAGV